jgi:stress-induced morphogen
MLAHKCQQFSCRLGLIAVKKDLTYLFRIPKMPMPAAEIEDLVKTALPDAIITLVDTAGDSDHYSITVVSSQFEGKTRVAQHKMVMNALGGNMGTKLHALAITTKTA